MNDLTELEKEWTQLIIEAKKLGIEISTIREFLSENKVKEKVVINSNDK
jgi:regulator of replication initiation timing